MAEHNEYEQFCYTMERPGHFCMQEPGHDGKHKFIKLTIVMDEDTAKSLGLNESKFLKITKEN